MELSTLYTCTGLYLPNCLVSESVIMHVVTMYNSSTISLCLLRFHFKWNYVQIMSKHVESNKLFVLSNKS